MNTVTALEYHLAHNHYPPVPMTMVPACLVAIGLAADGDWDGDVALPDGVAYKGEPVAPVWAVVEQHHLAHFVEQATAEWVIAGEEEHTYWSNEDGWTDLASATVFADGERDSLRLPIGGRWVSFG